MLDPCKKIPIFIANNALEKTSVSAIDKACLPINKINNKLRCLNFSLWGES